MKELGTKMNGSYKKATSKNLRIVIVKEQWLDKLCYKKVKLEKYFEKRNRKKCNMFHQDQKGVLWTLEAVEKRVGKLPKMQTFLEF